MSKLIHLIHKNWAASRLMISIVFGIIMAATAICLFFQLDIEPVKADYNTLTAAWSPEKNIGDSSVTMGPFGYTVSSGTDRWLNAYVDTGSSGEEYVRVFGVDDAGTVSLGGNIGDMKSGSNSGVLMGFISDNNNGAYVGWTRGLVGPDPNLLARVSSGGGIVWAKSEYDSNGVGVGGSGQMATASDGSLLFAYYAGQPGSYAICGMKLNQSDGSFAWGITSGGDCDGGAGGRMLWEAPGGAGTIVPQTITSDGAGGMMILATDYTDNAMKLRRIDTNGNTVYTKNMTSSRSPYGMHYDNGAVYIISSDGSSNRYLDRVNIADQSQPWASSLQTDTSGYRIKILTTAADQLGVAWQRSSDDALVFNRVSMVTGARLWPQDRLVASPNSNVSDFRMMLGPSSAVYFGYRFPDLGLIYNYSVQGIDTDGNRLLKIGGVPLHTSQVSGGTWYGTTIGLNQKADGQLCFNQAYWQFGSQVHAQMYCQNTVVEMTEGWYSYKHDYQNTGSTTDLGPTGNPANWHSTSFGSGSCLMSGSLSDYSVPAYDGKIYMNAATATNDNGSICVYNIDPPQFLGSTTNCVPLSTPVIQNDSIYVVCDDIINNTATTVVSFSAQPPFAENWHYGFESFWQYDSAPRNYPRLVYAEGTLYLFSSGSPDATVTAIDAAAGSEIYSRTYNGLYDDSPIFANGNLFVNRLQWSDNKWYLDKIDPATGSIVWSRFLFNNVFGTRAYSPTYKDGLIYDAGLVLYEDNTLKWSGFGGGHSSITDNYYISGYGGGGTNYLRAYSTTSGGQEWSKQFDAAPGQDDNNSEPVVSGSGTVFYCSGSGNLRAHDVVSGDQILVWDPGCYNQTPSIYQNKLIYPTRTGYGGIGQVKVVWSDLPPQISTPVCSVDGGANFILCDSVQIGNTLSHVQVDCEAGASPVAQVAYTLTDPNGVKRYENEAVTIPNGMTYTLNYPVVMDTDGTWSLHAVCKDDSNNTDEVTVEMDMLVWPFSGASAPSKLSIYDGVFQVSKSAGTGSTMEIGNGGRDFVSNGNIYLRPNTSLAGLVWEGPDNGSSQRLYIPLGKFGLPAVLATGTGTQDSDQGANAITGRFDGGANTAGGSGVSGDILSCALAGTCAGATFSGGSEVGLGAESSSAVIPAVSAENQDDAGLSGRFSGRVNVSGDIVGAQAGFPVCNSTEIPNGEIKCPNNGYVVGFDENGAGPDRILCCDT